MPHAGIFIHILIMNIPDDGLIEKTKLVSCVVYESGLNMNININIYKIKYR
jgi:hypothetical protein